ncbi:MAG: hypothetical protein ABJJ69_18510, partial [Paracoccaceae bacterium]
KGGTGADTFRFVAGDGETDRVTDFALGEDLLDLTAWGVTDFGELTIATSGDDLIVSYGVESLQLDGVTTVTDEILT